MVAGMAARRLDMAERLGRSAFELFAREGLEGANLDEIAAHAGVTKGSLYWHYGSRQELVLAACNHYYRRWQGQVHAALAPLTDPMVRLRRALDFSVRSCVADPANRRFTTGLFALMQSDAAVRSSWSQFYDTVREFYLGLVAAAQAAGVFPPGDARPRVDLMLEAMEGLKLRAAFEPHIADPAEQAAVAAGLLEAVVGGPWGHTRQYGRKPAAARRGGKGGGS